MIDDLKSFEYEMIEAMGYSIYEEIGRKQNGDNTWSKIVKEDDKFILTGTRYDKESFQKEDFREVYNTIDDFKAGKVSRE